MRRGLAAGLAAVGAVGLTFVPAGFDAESATQARAPGSCPPRLVGSAYTARVYRALRAGPDVWGNRLLRARDGPTYDGVARLLNPLFLARTGKGRPLTDSGAHYVAFGHPVGARGAGSVALHVADGSQVVSESEDGRRLTVRVGPLGRERYGACLRRLRGPRLREGYLPILATDYVDAAGVRYSQESFAARIPQTRFLVSFIQVTADAQSAARGAQVRFTPSARRLSAVGNRLARRGRAHLFFSAGGSFDGSSVRYAVPRGTTRTVYVAWLNYPRRSAPLPLDAARYEAVRTLVADYWQRRLAQGAQVTVPEPVVADALRGLLVQNLNHTWRYSIGNPYEQFSFPEGLDQAQVMAEWGFRDVAEAILRTSLTRRLTPYPNWKRGEKLVGYARYYELFRDRGALDRATRVLARYVGGLGRQVLRHPQRLLQRERYSSDIPDSVYGLHSQAVVWQGLRGIGRAWTATGRRALAARSQALARRLGGGLRSAVRSSRRMLPDGSLFVPVRLLDGERPYRALTESRPASYWNLVMPYALASGFFQPGSAEAERVLRYLLRHGSRFLGLVRTAGFSLYGRDRTFPTSGVNEVYGINASRFLADNDRFDQLVLSLYGHLGAGMTPGTFVSGEAGSIAPLGRRYHRAMYRPPNAASNAAFLVTLRLMLVHEQRDRGGAARGLELAYGTPRPWLRPGSRIDVRRVPTSFGPVSYSLEASERSVHAMITVPARARPRRLAVRLRLPRPNRLTSVTLNGRPYRRFSARTETVDLSGRSGRIELVVGYAPRPR